MPKAEWSGEQVYAAFGAFAQGCLQRDGSLFSPARTLWTRDNARALQDTIGHEDLSQGTFIGKLLDYLTGASADVIQMGAGSGSTPSATRARRCCSPRAGTPSKCSAVSATTPRRSH